MKRTILVTFDYFFQYLTRVFLICSLYDEDGYAAIKRVVERGEDVATVKPMAKVVVNYPVS